MTTAHPVLMRFAALTAAIFAALWLAPATAQEIVHFRSAGDNGPGQPATEAAGLRTRVGVVPIIGTDPAARADALLRVPAFLDRYLRD